MVSLRGKNVLLFKKKCLPFFVKQKLPKHLSVTKEFQSLPSDVKERLLNISNKNIIVDTYAKHFFNISFMFMKFA